MPRSLRDAPRPGRILSLGVPLVLVSLAAGALPALAAPSTLACAESHHLRWRGEAPELIVMDATGADREIGGTTVHLDPTSGEWYRAREGSAALTDGGGTFEIWQPSMFAAYYEEWVGVDGDAMLRIWGGGTMPMRFVFVSDDYRVVVGTCIEPDEPFIFLSGGELQ